MRNSASWTVSVAAAFTLLGAACSETSNPEIDRVAEQPEPKEEEVGAETRACVTRDDVSVRVTTDRQRYEPGETVDVTVTLRNEGDTRCVEPDVIDYTVVDEEGDHVAGGAVHWDHVDPPQTLEPGEAQMYEMLSWPQRTFASGQRQAEQPEPGAPRSERQRSADPGSYTVEVAVSKMGPRDHPSHTATTSFEIVD